MLAEQTGRQVIDPWRSTISRLPRTLASFVATAALVSALLSLAQPTSAMAAMATTSRIPGAGTLLSGADVAHALGGTWTVSDTSTPATVQACSYRPARGALGSVSRNLVGSHGYARESMSEVQEVLPSTRAAEIGFARAVRAFTRCKGAEIVDWPTVRHDRLARALASAGGLGQTRMLSLSAAVPGGGIQQTVVGIGRFGSRLVVVVWMSTTNDNPFDFDDGAVELLRTAASRLTGERPATVPAAALLRPTEGAIARLRAGTPRHVMDQVDFAALGTPCGFAPGTDARTAGSRTRTLFDDRSVAEVNEHVRTHTSRAAARSVLVETLAAATCRGIVVEDASAIDVGERVWLVSTSVASGRHVHYGAVQVGRSVAFVTVTARGSVSEHQARDILRAAGLRLAGAIA